MIVYLSLGANLGNREETLDKAVQLLATHVGPLIKRSSFFYSKPWGFDSPNDFCNICASFETTLDPISLLYTTQQIEKQLGRTRENEKMGKWENGKMRKWENEKMRKYHDRPIDIDILLYGDLNIDTPELTLPHKNMREREFVMVPLREIAPELSYFAEK